MATIDARRTWIGVTVPVSSVPQSLYDLVAAIDPRVPGYAREWTVQTDPDNTPTGSFTGSVLVGDDSVSWSPLRCAFKVSQSGSAHISGSIIGVPLTSVWVVTDDTGGTIALNVGVSI